MAKSASASVVAFSVKGAGSQSANLLNGLNSSGTVLSYINASGNLGVRMGATAATAYLHLAAGTATAGTAPLKFSSGVSLATPEAGAIEFSTDTLFATITTGAARKGFVLDDGARLTAGRIPAATTNGRLVDGPVPVADGTYTVGIGPVTNGTITVSKGLITAIQQAS